MKQDVGDIAQGYTLAQFDMGMDLGWHFEHFACQDRAQAVFGIPAIDLIPDPPFGIDVAAAALQEEGFTPQDFLDDLPRRCRGNQMIPYGNGDQRRPGWQP